MRFVCNLLWVAVGSSFVSQMAFASEGATKDPYTSIAAAFAIGIAVVGGAMGQSKAAASALDGLSRNPQAKVFVPFMLSIALIESLVIYAFVIAYKLIS